MSNPPPYNGPCLSTRLCGRPADDGATLCHECAAQYAARGWDFPHCKAGGADRIPFAPTRHYLRRIVAYLDKRHLLAETTTPKLARELGVASARSVERYARHARWLDDHYKVTPWVRAAADEDPLIELTVWDWTAAIYMTAPHAPWEAEITAIPQGETGYEATITRNGRTLAVVTGDRRARSGRLRWPLPEITVAHHLLEHVVTTAPWEREPVRKKRRSSARLSVVTTTAPRPEPVSEQHTVTTITPDTAVPYRDPNEEATRMLGGLTVAPGTHPATAPTPPTPYNPGRAAALGLIYAAAADAGFAFADVTMDDIRNGHVTIPEHVRQAVRDAIARMDDTFMGDYIAERRTARKAAASA